MPQSPTSVAPTDFDARMTELLASLSIDPANLALHKELRDVALRRKIAGGRGAGLLDKLWPRPKAPAERLVRACRLWAMDPGDLDLLVRVSQAVEFCAEAMPGVDFLPVREWLLRIARAAGVFERSD